jgi:sugar lactone lactonase YvrE
MGRTFCLTLLLFGLVGQVPAPAQTHGDLRISTDWFQMPPNMALGLPLSVSCQAGGIIAILRRQAEPPILLFTNQGNFVRGVGEGLFTGAHSVRFDREGFLWAIDNTDNVVYKFAVDGKLLMTLGKRGMKGDNASQDLFDGPSDVNVALNGDIFVTDGYRNSRIVRFSREGKFVGIIGGTKGKGPGEFDLPHAIAIDSQGRLLVTDRNNFRIQVLDQNGNFIEQWTDVGQPSGIYVSADDMVYTNDLKADKIFVLNNRGKIVRTITGQGWAHLFGMDSAGNLYTADDKDRTVKKVSTP